MTKFRSLLQFTVVLGLALSAGACQTMADLDPTGLLGDSTPSTPDPTAPAPSDASIGTTPDLASLPARPATSGAVQQQQQAQSLAADGAQVQYSADVLRGGTEAAAPVPGAPPPPSAMAMAMAAPPPPPAAAPIASDLPPTTEAAPPMAAPTPAPAPPPQARAAGTQLAAVPAVGPAASDLPPTADAPPSAAPAPMAPMPQSSMPQSSIPQGAQPAVPANTPVRGSSAMMARATPSDAELGFRPSAAPPLDPSINDWVPAPIVARYRQANANAGVAVASNAAVPQRGVGGPDMSGAVVANLGALPTGSAGAIGGVTPTAVVYFAGDGSSLSAAARSEIRGAVQAFKASGGAGIIRVVGHASSRTANMPVEKHLEVIFDKSQSRANVVAQELIHQGIPAAKVLVEAVGDSQPVYYESMPKGEDGNRRAEIFVQS